MGTNFLHQDSGMKDNRPKLEILLFVFLGLMAVLAIARNVSAAPGKLPSGIVLDLTQEQRQAIKN